MDLAKDLSPWRPFLNLANEQAECFALFLVLHLQIPSPPPLNKALFLCKPSHPTDTPGLVCALHQLEAPIQTLPMLQVWWSSPLRASQPGLTLLGKICNAEGSCGRGNLQLPG